MIIKSLGATLANPSQMSSDGVQEDTIVAIATPAGRGGIGIVRISGPKARSIAQRVFRPGRSKKKSKAAFNFRPHHLHYGHIVDPASNQIRDEALVVYMPRPHSYTCEDVIEVQAHAGPAVLRKILSIIIDCGARPAEAGEFTRRAFLNGRIDLTQAEAVVDIICAESEEAAELAARQMSGEIRLRVKSVLDEIESVCAEMEAYHEFPDDVEDSKGALVYWQTINEKMLGPVQQLIGSYAKGRLLRDGIQVTIAGRPNVGKSTLLNRLIDTDKAITSAFPGTTRDPVEAQLLYRGIEFRFTDTAGVHCSIDPIEAIGIHKSKEAIEQADLVLLVVAAAELSHPGNTEVYQISENKRNILVVNKIDLVNNVEALKAPEYLRSLPVVRVSALNGTGMADLKRLIFESCLSGPIDRKSDTIISSLRHKRALEKSAEDLERGLQGLIGGLPYDLIGMDLRSAGDALRAITGEQLEDGLLEQIFGRFCIGK